VAFFFVFVPVELVLYTFLCMHDDGREVGLGRFMQGLRICKTSQASNLLCAEQSLVGFWSAVVLERSPCRVESACLKHGKRSVLPSHAASSNVDSVPLGSLGFPLLIQREERPRRSW
jgi:hypothetical protein